MPDIGYDGEPAIRHDRGHRPEIGRRNPTVPLAPQHQVRMMNLGHPALQFATLPLAGEIDRRTDPDALGNTKCLFEDSLEQRLDLANSVAEPRNRIRRKAIR